MSEASKRIYVGTLKGVGRIYQQTFVDNYSKLLIANFNNKSRKLNIEDINRWRSYRNDQLIDLVTRQSPAFSTMPWTSQHLVFSG
ncbi:hypothetical protein [Thiosulfativibrio zosterae]|uniref:Uncharacterized protein n=1 Tax=Thiosulfativibrio zosterae TaxID=2675053 RepID=A0A6F8PMW7_9GAMM|nr:hypothetical protein [Thiosulfativibrio zosterae]BBP43449.1 hypothetical protein THMIRHAT_11950 [Thiosulfativibrio zosterae]